MSEKSRTNKKQDPEGRCPRVLRGNARLGSQWVLSGFSVGSQKMNIFQKVDKNNFHKKKAGKITKKNTEKKAGSHGCSVGFSVGSQWVLSGYSVSTQGSQWVLRLSISEYSGGSQVGTSPRIESLEAKFRWLGYPQLWLSG